MKKYPISNVGLVGGQVKTPGHNVNWVAARLRPIFMLKETTMLDVEYLDYSPDAISLNAHHSSYAVIQLL